MVATSLPEGIDEGTLSARPTMPSRAISSMCGVRAACNGVRPPSEGCGSSAQPAGMTRGHFIFDFGFAILDRVLISRALGADGGFFQRGQVNPAPAVARAAG